MKKFLIAVLLLFVYSTSHADDFTFESGPSIGDQPAHLFLITYGDDDYEIYNWLQPRTHVGVIRRERFNYYVAGVDLLIGHDYLEPSVLLNLGLSQFVNEKPERLGTKLNFHLTVEVRWDIVDIRCFGKFTHWSNGGGSILPAGNDRNIGEDFLVIGFVF